MPDFDFTPFMTEAVGLARLGRWLAAPNPMVGAVLVKDGRTVAQGFHERFGGPHAEVACLADAARKGVDPRGCTLVVTLEPCNHTGKTGPCTQAILDAGIPHVVIGMLDPNPLAAGGARRLAERGVRVDAGVCEEACRELIGDFLVWQGEGRPYVILKLATTVDGHIADRTGNARWISGEASRASVHGLRAGIGLAGGMVVVGGNTLLKDNPLLTARDVPCTRQPLAGCLISRFPVAHRPDLLVRRPEETVLFTPSGLAATPQAAELRGRGVRIFGLSRWKEETGEDVRQFARIAFRTLRCPYVLCEGGGTVAHSLLKAGLVDELRLYVSPKVLDDALAPAAFGGRDPVPLDQAAGMRTVDVRRLGDDVLIVYRRRSRTCSRA